MIKCFSLRILTFLIKKTVLIIVLTAVPVNLLFAKGETPGITEKEEDPTNIAAGQVSQLNAKNEVKVTITPTPEALKTPTPHQTVVSGGGSTKADIPESEDLPRLIIIPKISLYAPITESGKLEDGGMEVPPDEKTVGWWKYGSIPGQIGSAVFAGHYKTEKGKPGVFYNLNKLKVGDEIFVSSVSGKMQTFVISEMKVYSLDSFPLHSFFNSNDAKRLNLITCAGKYSKEVGTYTHRLAVNAILK